MEVAKNEDINEELLTTLMSMGFEKNVAEEALLTTNNASVEAAVNYVFNKQESRNSESSDGPIENYKMTFVVNTSLKMGVGKTAAQVAHACLGLYRDMLEKGLMGEVLYSWEYIGEKKIVLKGIDHNHLMELYEKSKEKNIPSFLVQDAGRTQIPEGSITVLSIFGLEDEVDSITGKLSLL